MFLLDSASTRCKLMIKKRSFFIDGNMNKEILSQFYVLNPYK